MSKAKRMEQELLDGRMSRGSETDKSYKKKFHPRSLSRILERVRTRTQQERQDLR